ncbi:autotransporter outer membrane beta-barrel domain-containing protein, partial [Bartonella doshiae]|uniref:autotransporter outer membrane beta-barrel domain-containing protein n=1 Tax=Bartonella doshiae TaxID=33044 RepID=UPI001ABAF68E
MCNKSIYKKKILLCTIAGTLIFSHCNSTYANTQPNKITMISVDKGEKKTFDNVFVRGRFTTGTASEKGIAIITKSTMRSDSALLSATTGGHIHAKEIVGKAGTRGMEIANGMINIEDSTITVSGHHKSWGIFFDHIISSSVQKGEKVTNKATLANTKLLVENGIGIVGPSYSKAIAEVQLTNSEIRSDMLLKNKTSESDAEPGTLILTATNSFIEGRVKTLPQNTTIFTLNNNSNWHLKISQFEADQEFSVSKAYKLTDINQRAQSVVSILNLNSSSLVFNAPNAQTLNYYQTLHVGRHPQTEKSELQKNRTPAVTKVYNATGDATIYFNIEWSDGLPKEQQKADRLLIHGDVSGTTTVYVNNLLEGETLQTENSIPLNTRGLSLIQVSGKADENAFQLANGYLIVDGSPYKYILRAYGPTSSHGKANVKQSFLGKNKSFWDFRLQSATLDPEEKIRALVPQTASYL